MATITMTMERDGFTAKAKATYDRDAEGGWWCELLNPCARPDVRESSDAVVELHDILECELDARESEHAFNAGPYSTTQTEA
jgi:hypothetical protein